MIIEVGLVAFFRKLCQTNQTINQTDKPTNQPTHRRLYDYVFQDHIVRPPIETL